MSYDPAEPITMKHVDAMTLPFSDKKQDALLGHYLENEKFFSLVQPYIKPDWFLNTWNQKICAIKAKFVKEFRRHPTRAELEGAGDIELADTREQLKIRAQINIVSNAAKEFGADVLIKEMKLWMEARRIRKGVEEIQIKFNAGRISEANSIAKQMARDVDGMQFDDDGAWKFDLYADQFDKALLQRETALTFGVSVMDRILLPEATGGLLPGDHTLLLAPTNVGKTTSMITVAMHNIRRGKDVLFITHEGRPEDINEKMWCSLTQQSKPDIFRMYKDPAMRPAMDNAVAMFNKHLTFLPRNKAGMTVQELDSVIRRQFEKKMAQTGKGYDLVVNDYPAKLSYEGAGKWEFRQSIDRIYAHLGTMAEDRDLQFHLLSAIQSNREGARTNKGENGRDRLLTDTDVSEAYGPCQTAANVISINRSPLAEARDRVTYYVCKSRSNQKGFAVVCKSRYGIATTHSDRFGATWYRGTSTMDEKIDGLIEQYKGREIDRDKLDEDTFANTQ